MKKLWKTLRMDLWVFVLDVIAVNLSWFLALVFRFYMNGQFRSFGSEYSRAWACFAPYYTVIALVIFICCRLYGGMWQYVGLNDMNRIILANILAGAAMLIGTLIFVKRMPITFYIIGTLNQMAFTMLIRFSYRLLLAEKKKVTGSGKIPALVVGSDDLGKRTVRHMDEVGIYQPVAIIGQDVGRSMDGVPVMAYKDLNKVMGRVQAVFIADRDLDEQRREEIKEAAKGKELFDFTGALSNSIGAVPLTGLLQTVSGPVTIRINGQETRYESSMDALKELHTRYLVTDISGDALTVELVEDDGTAYLMQHMAETGEMPSFF